MATTGTGSEADFRKLFETYKNRVFGYVYAIVKSHHSAEEITQELFIKLWTSRELLAQTASMATLDEKLLEELLRAIIQLRRTVAGENLNQLRFLQEEVQEEGDSRASFYQDVVLQHTKLLRDLDQARRRMIQKRLD